MNAVQTGCARIQARHLRGAAPAAPLPSRRAKMPPSAPLERAADQHPHQHALVQRLAGEHAEVRVVAGHGNHQEAGRQHADQHQSLPAQHRAPAQLLDGEDHAGQRRVEGRGQPAGRAGCDQFIGVETAQSQATALPEIAPGQHHGRAHLHRRAFAANGGASQHAQKASGTFHNA